MRRGILWDLDGTLVDSTELHWHAWHDTMAGEGVSITREMFESTFGWKNDPILRRWMGDGTPEETKLRVADTKERRYREALAREGVQPLPGAREWVERLRAEGWRQAVASSAPLANIDAVLDALDMRGDFDAIVSAEDVTLGKPDPQVFLLAAQRLGVEVARAVVVEDAVAGVEAARRGGFKSIGVNPKLTLDADLYVRSLTEIQPRDWDALLQ